MLQASWNSGAQVAIAQLATVQAAVERRYQLEEEYRIRALAN
jgi:hypothetical protein